MDSLPDLNPQNLAMLLIYEACKFLALRRRKTEARKDSLQKMAESVENIAKQTSQSNEALLAVVTELKVTVDLLKNTCKGCDLCEKSTRS